MLRRETFSSHSLLLWYQPLSGSHSSAWLVLWPSPNSFPPVLWRSYPWSISFIHQIQVWCYPLTMIFVVVKIFIIYLLRERENAWTHTEAGEGRSRGRGRSSCPTEQRAPQGAQSQDPEVMTKAEGRFPTI